MQGVHMQNPVPNAYTLAIGGRKPFIVIHTALLELLEPPEVQVHHAPLQHALPCLCHSCCAVSDNSLCNRCPACYTCSAVCMLPSMLQKLCLGLFRAATLLNLNLQLSLLLMC